MKEGVDPDLVQERLWDLFFSDLLQHGGGDIDTNDYYLSAKDRKARPNLADLLKH